MLTFEAQTNKFYLLVLLNLTEVVISEDVCIMISTKQKAKIKNFQPIKFRYWLNAKWLRQRVGNNTLQL